MTAIKRDELIVFVVEPMPRQHLVRMGNRHPREARVVKTQRRATGRVPLAEQPFTIERINTSASVCDILCRAGVQRKQRSPNQPHTAAFDETSSVYSPLHLV